jgi:transcriptional regulator with PAS, ATPase and Fis domain
MIVKNETYLNRIEKELKERRAFHNIIGKNTKMQEIYSLAEIISNVDSMVLITGETGTGKELMAEAIHYKGNRSNKPFIKLNCLAIPDTLLEAELFGSVKGSFTGANKDRKGRFEMAEGGTIFLDEIGDISPHMQMALLRVIEEKTIERIGEGKSCKIDVRIITATNKDLIKQVEKGLFRQDLYYRLTVLKIHIPPLRERTDDIPLLIKHFIEKFNSRFKKEITDITDDVLKIFMNYEWPGNIREMEHILEHACIICKKNIIDTGELPKDFLAITGNDDKKIYSKKYDIQALKEALLKAGGNKTTAASILGISRQHFYRLIAKYNI